MKYFCEQAVELPTLKSLASDSLNYAYRPDVVAICAQQATTISDTIVKESTASAFATINTVLQDQLELAFHGQSSSDTIQRHRQQGERGAMSPRLIEPADQQRRAP